MATYPVMTLAEIRQAARRRADRENASGVYTSSFVTDNELDSYINSSLAELYDLLAAQVPGRYFVETENITTDGTNDHFALPSDFYKLLGVDMLVSGTGSSAGDRWARMRPFNYCDRNGTHFDSRVPQANLIARVRYVPKVIPLSASGTITLNSQPSSGDTLAISVAGSIDESVTLTAGTSYVIGGTTTVTATNLAAAINAWSDGQCSATSSLGVVTVTPPTAPVTWLQSNVARMTLAPTGTWQSQFDGIGGWLEYVVVDAARKMLLKEESDASALAGEKAALRARILEMAPTRDQGEVSTVRDTQSANAIWPHGGFWAHASMRYALENNDIWLVPCAPAGFGQW